MADMNLTITFPIGYRDDQGTQEVLPFRVRLTLTDLWKIVVPLQQISPQSVIDLYDFMKSLEGQTKAMQEQGDLPPEEGVLAAIIESIARLVRIPKTNANTDLDRVLMLTYGMLRRGDINYTQAAKIASELLKQDITANAWRLRMVRWIDFHGLPPITGRRGRPKKSVKSAV